MKRKLMTTIAFFMIMLLCTSPVFALTINTGNSENATQGSNAVVPGVTTLELVEKKLCEMDLKDSVTGDVIANFTKELTDFDASKKEATLTLTLKSLLEKISSDPEKIDKPVEIYLVLDNSDSMGKTYQGTVKKEYVSQVASLFTDYLFEYFTNPKIGIVSFSCVEPVDTESETFHDGTQEDAKLLLALSDSKDTIKSKITEYKNAVRGQHTNMEAGLSLAETNFTTSTDSEKYVILISDGVPNLCLNTETTLQYSGVIASSTKQKLQSMENKGYHIFSVLMGLNESDKEIQPEFIANSDTAKTYRQLAEEIFGTVTNPTVGNFFYIDYDSLNSTINTEILKEIANTEPVIKDNPIKNIVIKDYFPQEIIDNFNFEYVKSPNIGKVSQKIDTTDNSITWNIEVLSAGEVATLSYKLTLKDNYDKAIVDKILPTNSKVDINYEHDDVEGNTSSTVSPTVRVKYVESAKDDTVAKKPIPQTGMYTTILFAIITVGIVVFMIIRANQIKKLY